MRAIAALCLALSASTARAETAAEAVQLVYDAPPLCPSHAEFVADVRRALPELHIAEGTGVRRFDVVIAADGRAGSLRIDRGAAGMREVEGSDCARVSRLLAFATALAIDPNALAEASSPPPEPLTSPAQVTREDAPPKPEISRKVRGSLAAFSLLESAAAPHATLGAGLSGLVSMASARPEPALRLGAGYASSSAARIDATSVTFQTLFGLLELCPATLRRGSLAVRPCLRSEGGLRITTAHDAPDARRAKRPWFSVGAAAHARLALGARWFVELGAGILFPLVRDRVLLTPDTTVHRVPAVGALGELSVGVEFGDQKVD
jgi:hypothetical protein